MGHIARMVDTRNAYDILVGNPVGKIPLGKTMNRWKLNINGSYRSSCVKEYTGLKLIKIWSSCGMLCKRQRTFVFGKRRVISWPTELRSLCSVDLVNHKCSIKTTCSRQHSFSTQVHCVPRRDI
jgi:hypothetical protein